MGSSYPGLLIGIETDPSVIFIPATSAASAVAYFNSMNDAWAVRPAVLQLPSYIGCLLILGHLVLGNPQSTASWLSTRPFLYPGNDYRLRGIDGWLLCRRPGCPQCAASPEAVTTHLECFELFTRTYTRVDALDRLWREASWRRPWREAPLIVLPEDMNVTSKAVMIVAKRYGLPELLKMPPEIRQMVRNYSQSSLFWRFTAALDLAARFDAAPTSRFSSIPVRRIAEWERGCVPTQTKALISLPIIRLTIDSRGIRKFERLPAGEPYSSRSYDRTIYIIEDESRFDGVSALFKDGQVRLELPEGHTGFHIWDTPMTPLSPQQVPQTCLYGSIDKPNRFYTIETSSVTGLTFFFTFGSFYAIHVHTDARPYAAIPPECLSRRLQSITTWNYVPVPANDRVLAIGLRGLPSNPLDTHCFLIRTKLAGNISIGPWVKEHSTVHMLANPPTTLIYGRNKSKKLSVLGAFPKATFSDGTNPAFSNLFGPERCPFTSNRSSYEVNFSAAPLNDVTFAQVFHQEGRSWSRGLILKYQNGAKRALGDCRVGVDPYKMYRAPRILCISMLLDRETHGVRELHKVRTRFISRSTGDDEVQDDKFYEMNGTLHFWFHHEQSYADVLPT
ncbi:hypothetical protein F4861DRAFT_381574 [Xylaria intraflava]|nr:hypothetical protein F4861DRAFT_381574 [Xylaria intraflava]